MRGCWITVGKLKEHIDSALTEMYYRKYFEWGFPTRRFIQVHIETNSVCTRSCHQCIFGIKKVPAKYMASPLFFTIIDQLVEMRFVGRISLFELNEPLTDKRIYDFTKYVSYVLPDCYQLLVTNGDILNRERMDTLFASGLDLLGINSYDMESLKKNEDLFRYGTENYTDKIMHCDRTDFSLWWESRAGHIKQYAREPVHEFCEYPNYIFYVKPDGRVLSCWNDFDEVNIMGDLTIETIKTVWHGKKFRALRRSINKGNRKISSLCNRCDHKPDINYIQWNRMLARKKSNVRGPLKDDIRLKMLEQAQTIKRSYLESSHGEKGDTVSFAQSSSREMVHDE
jgi:radical SAM protein with 4Fe4S-binding SPASM domain